MADSSVISWYNKSNYYTAKAAVRQPKSRLRAGLRSADFYKISRILSFHKRTGCRLHTDSLHFFCFQRSDSVWFRRSGIYPAAQLLAGGWDSLYGLFLRGPHGGSRHGNSQRQYNHADAGSGSNPGHPPLPHRHRAGKAAEYSARFLYHQRLSHRHRAVIHLWDKSGYPLRRILSGSAFL